MVVLGIGQVNSTITRDPNRNDVVGIPAVISPGHFMAGINGFP